MIDLDHNATTRPEPAVISAVCDALARAWHNPSSVHRAGQEARRVIELARLALADLIGAKPGQVLLTSGATEALRTGILGAAALLPPERRLIVTSPIEHAAVADTLAHAPPALGLRLGTLPLDASGVIDPAGIDGAITDGTGLVAVQWANNETGAVMPIGLIARRCALAGALLLVDGSQWVGKMPTRVRPTAADTAADGPLAAAGSGAADDPALCRCDMLAFAPHKFHGPKGVGVLWTAPGVRLSPLQPGSQERGRRGGTENVPGIAGAGAAALAAAQWLADPAHIAAGAALRDAFERAVLAACPGSRVNGPAEHARRIWNTTNIAFPRLEAEALLMAFSEAGLLASAGAACSSGSLDPSPVLLAMGVPPALAHGSVRFSIGRHTTPQELDRAVAIVTRCVARLGASMPPDLPQPGR